MDVFDNAETTFGGVPMGSPIDPSEHPVNNLAPRDQMPLGSSGASYAAEHMPHGNTADAAKHVKSKRKGRK